MSRPRALLLAGTAQARALAARLAGREDLEAISSLAGVTERPERYAGALRVGGFGGAEGLAAWLRAERIGAVLDATHPFAARISANARAACLETGVAYARLERPAWAPEPGDAWTPAADARAAAAALPSGARALLTLGRGGLAAFAARADVRVVARMIERPEPGAAEFLEDLILARPPFTLEAETALLRRLRATHLVTRNAGGASGRSKLLAARALGLPVVMIARPGPAPAQEATSALETVDAALRWLEAALSRRSA